MENETWKDIPGYEGIYQASSLGRIKSVKRDTKNQFGKEDIILKTFLGNTGYCIIGLSNKGRKKYLVHRLIWVTFNGIIQEGMQINHINEIKTDNRLENLELVTARGNLNYGNHNKRVSSKMTNGKLSKIVLQYDLEGNLIKEWPSTMEIQRELKYANQSISICCRGIKQTAYGYIWKYK